jgi:pimeloyl-ACP methyl ester carboxylesterase
MIHRLPDGRALGYAEYGDLTGFPVFFFHGTPGSKAFHPPLDVTERMGVRLICVERPGYGESTFQPNRRLLDWGKDIASLADFLKLDRFAVSGHSGGGPHTLACACALADRVTAAAILSGAGPIDTPNATEGMIWLNWFGFTFGRYMPWWFAQPLTAFLFRKQAADPTIAIKLDDGIRPQPDDEILHIPEIRENCIQSDLGAYAQGTRGLAWDVRLITRPWGFKLEDIKVPVYLWHGTADNSTTMNMVRYMEERIPNCEATLCEGEAHMLLIPHWEEVLTTLVQTPVVA